MAYKFWNITEANAEISRLETALKDAATQNEALAANAPAIEAEAKRISADLAASNEKLAKVEADHAITRQSLAAVTTERDAAQAELKAAKDKLANPGEQIKQTASAQAAAIVAQVGHAPLGVTPKQPGNSEDKTVSRESFDKMNHVQRNEFFRSGGKIAN